jgi:hypothetical protein
MPPAKLYQSYASPHEVRQQYLSRRLDQSDDTAVAWDKGPTLLTYLPSESRSDNERLPPILGGPARPCAVPGTGSNTPR